MKGFTLIRRLNLAMTGLGVAVFALLLGLVNFAPDQFQEHIKSIVIKQTTAQVSEALSGTGVSFESAQNTPINPALVGAIQSRIEKLQNGLDQDVETMVADVLASACKLDCERREQAEAMVRGYMEGTIARLRTASGNLEQLILGKYETVMGDIRADLNIFAGSNLGLLALSFLLSLYKPGAARHLLPVAVILTLQTALMSVWYVFGQNWVMTLIFSDYWGWGYPLMQSVLALLLLDIAVNAGRVVTWISNAVLNVVGSSLHLAPC